VLGADALEADLLAANIARAMGASARRIVETLDDEQQSTDNFCARAADGRLCARV